MHIFTFNLMLNMPKTAYFMFLVLIHSVMKYMDDVNDIFNSKQ